jgi:hypothetical protein
MDLAEIAGSMRSSGGLVDAMVSLAKTTSDVFPANRVFMRCAKCKAPIARYEGYRHIRVGDHRTFCGSCHAAMGLPLDERRGGPAALGLS